MVYNIVHTALDVCTLHVYTILITCYTTPPPPLTLYVTPLRHLGCSTSTFGQCLLLSIGVKPSTEIRR